MTSVMENISATVFRTLSSLKSNATNYESSTPTLVSTMPLTFWVVPALLAYPVLVSILRFRSINGLQKKYGYDTRESLAKMTDQEAFEVLKTLNEMEFPAMYEKGLQFALFRTYGIPTISDLLVKTTQLTTTQNVGKRYADTSALLVEMYGNAPSSERGIEGFSRLNYLHGHYIRQRKISNDDMLYTLALFMNKPVEWINKTEWRQLTDLEICAMGVFHKSMGDAMEIDFGVLQGSRTGFEDGLHFYQELDNWSKEYEQAVMLPHRNNYLTAVETRTLLLSTIPPFMHNPIKGILAAGLDDLLREAIMFDKPAPIYLTLLAGFIELRRFLLRYFALPRPSFWPSELVGKDVEPDGRRHFTRYDTLPIYVKPTFMNRWGPGAWTSRLMGVPLPGDDKMHPEGFRTRDVGPATFLGKGSSEIEKTKQRLRKERTGGCPFATLK